jgi:hypothetical protein
MGRFSERILISGLLTALCMCSNAATGWEIKPNSGEENKLMQEQMTKGPTLKTEITLKEGTLLVEYRIVNTTDNPIYVFNGLWDLDQANTVIRDPRQAYVSLMGTKTLHLVKGILPVPNSRKVESRVIPFATKIEAGQELSERMELPVPVEEYSPYFPKNQDSQLVDGLAESVVLTINYVRESDALELAPSPLSGSFSVWHPDLPGVIETLSSGQKPLSVRVKKRTDAFEEF